MAQKNRTDLKTYFEIGKRPTQEQFADFIDSVINKLEDGISINDNNNIGIGTANPSTRLEVVTQDSWNIPPFRIGSDDSNEPAVDFKSGTDTFSIAVNNGTTNAFQIDHTAVENSLVIRDGGNIGIGTDNPNTKLHIQDGILLQRTSVDQNHALSLNNQSANRIWNMYQLSTTDPTPNGFLLEYFDGNNYQRRFTIDQNGNIGIGTDNPQHRLHVENGHILIRNIPPSDLDPSLTGLHLTSRNSGGGDKRWALYTAATGGGYGVQPNAFEIWEYPEGASRFRISPGGTTVFALGSASVGIGTVTPNPTSGMHMYQDRYTLYGPNTSHDAYLQVGGNGRQTTYASVAATNGNLHLDSADGGYYTYINHYSQGHTILNTNGGSVGIGTTSFPAKLSVNGHAFKTDGGSNWQTVSDKRLKKNIKPFKDSLKLLKKVMPVWYRYNGKAETDDTDENVGIIAQDIQKVFPYMVSGYKARLNTSDKEDIELLTFDGSALKFVIINAIKELDARLEKLEALLSRQQPNTNPITQ